ncbi:methyltransferase domain-containing protein [Nocardioides sp.]|uniref:class I SAM-dependent methyltransferase n=1 Tax=Nocardioides sp. TaxID=35761 RepID=UPI00286D0AC2|nr:methyltransferase domain-containing protein [Nocardioides sp.]
MHQIATSYDAMAEVYAERFGDVELQHPLDRAVFSGFAGLLERDGATATAVADLGCGPGHWSAELASYGFDVVGIDGSAGLLAIARSRHPEVTFEQGDLGALALDDRSLDGAVAWFSLIHTEPAALDRLLRELARVLRPGGLLLTGFQVGDGTEPEAFDHRVVRAWRWPVDTLSRRLAAAGLTEVARGVRQPAEGERLPGGHLVSQRTDA